MQISLDLCPHDHHFFLLLVTLSLYKTEPTVAQWKNLVKLCFEEMQRKSNKLVVEILLIKWYTKCYVEWNVISWIKPEKLFGKGNESKFFYNIYWKNLVKLCFEEMQRKISYKSFIWNTAQTGNTYNSVIMFLLFQMCRRHFCHRANKWSLERFDVKPNKLFKRDTNIELSQCLFLQ